MTTKLSAVQRLQADIVGAGRDGALDRARQQLLERREQHVLQVDGQRQQPVEEGRDRRQLVLDARWRRSASGRSRPRTSAASSPRPCRATSSMIELAQRIAGIVAFQIVLGPEQALPAGLALARGDGARACRAAGRWSRGSASRPSRRWRSAGTAAAAPGWCGWCGRGPGWRHRPSSRLRADNGRAAAGSAPRVRRDSCARCRRRREKTRMRLSSSMNACGLGEIGRGRRGSRRRAGRRPPACGRCGASVRSPRRPCRCRSAGRSGRARRAPAAARRAARSAGRGARRLRGSATGWPSR